MFGMTFEIAFNKMIIKRSMTAANADGILTDPVTSETDWSAVQGVFGWSGAGDHLGADMLADAVVFSTSNSSDADSEAASWKDTSCLRHCQHALSSGFRTLQYYNCLETS